MQTSRRFAILAIAAAVLSGCATTGSLSQAPVADYRDNIELTGRIAVNYQKDGQPQSLLGRFSWTQQRDRVDVSLLGPVGQTLATISVTPAEAVLAQSGREPRVASDIDALTAETLGWDLPVSGLRDWLQGYATDAGGKRFAASPAKSSVFTRDGWRLRFVEWQDEAAARPTPRVISAERSATAQSDELAIRIVIDPAA